MSRQWDEQIDEFDAVDGNGQRHRVQEWVGMADLTPLGSETKRAGRTGSRRYCTSTGLTCNLVDDQTFEIVALGLTVTRVAGANKG
jgi:hypothetical protein